MAIVKNKFARIVLDSEGRQVLLIKCWSDNEDTPHALEITGFLNGVKATTTNEYFKKAVRNDIFKTYSQAQADNFYKALENIL